MKNLLLVYFLLSFTVLPAQTLEIDKLKKIVAQQEHLPDNSVLSAMNDLFEENYYRGDTTQAVYYADLLIQKAKERGHLFYERQGSINKSYTLFKYKREEGLALIDSILQIALKDNDQLLIGQCYIYLGKDRIIHLKQDSSCFYFNKAQTVFKNINTIKSIEVLLGLAHCTSSSGDFLKALDYVTEGYKQAIAAKNDILAMKTLNKMWYWNIGANKQAKATELLVEAKNLGEKNGYLNRDLIEVYQGTADSYWVTNGRLDIAREYMEKAYQLSQKVDNNLAKAKAATGLAYYLIQKPSDNLQYAKELLEYSLKVSDAHNLENRKIKAHHYLGLLYREQKLFIKASDHFVKAILLCEASAYYKSSTMRIQKDMSQILDKVPNSSNLLVFIDSLSNNIDTMGMKKKIHSLTIKIWLYKTKMILSEKKREFQTAYEWSKKVYAISKLHYDKVLEASIEERLLECQLDAKNKELGIKNELVQSTIFRNKILLFSTVLSVLFLGILYFFYYTKKQLNQKIIKQNKEISKNMELVASLNENLNSKNELLAKKNTLQEKEIVDFIAFQSSRDQQLKSIKSEVSKALEGNTATIPALQIITTKVEKLVSKENEWIYFKQKIESLYPNFFRALLLKHPDLNEREQLHCSYILLGMNVKKVAESIFVSIKAVESARYRVKKKIGLDKMDNLSVYIKSFGMG